MSKIVLFIFIVSALFSERNAFSQNLEDNKVSIKNVFSSLSFSEKSDYSSPGFGIRGGIGTDITGGIGFGAGVFYVIPSKPYSSTWWDLGADIYYANVSEEETDSEGTRFEDNTKVFVFTLRSNGLFNYHPGSSGVYFVAGAGIVMANIDWEETVTYDPSHYPGIGPEHWSDDAFAFGNVLNLGVGLTLGGGWDTRLETPLLIFYSTPGNGGSSASTIAPTFTLNILYRFP